MFLVESISYCSSRLDDFHTARAIRMAAKTKRVILDWQLHSTSIRRSHRLRSQLLRDMLFHVLVLPWPIS